MAFAKRRYLSNRPFKQTLGRALLIVVGFSRQILCLALLFCLGWPLMAVAEEVGASGPGVDASEVVTFAIADVWPWAFEDHQGNPRGSLVDVMNRLSELTGVPVEPQIRPVRRAINELHSGGVNFSILFQSPIQDREAIHVAPVVSFNIMMVALAETDYPLDLEALTGKRVAFIRGTYLGDAFARNEKVDKAPVALVSQALEMLFLGRISAILASDHALARTLEAMNLRPDMLRYERHVPDQLGVLYMSSKAQRPLVAEKFRKAIAQMSEEGELNAIFFGESGRPQQDGRGREINTDSAQ